MLLHRLSGLTLVTILASSAVASNSTCYYPNGDKNGGTACNADADVSACCGPTFVCLSNGLCQVGPETRRTYAYNVYRSGCTDASFNSSSCPQICIGEGYNNDRGQGVRECGNDTYCCGGARSSDCCSDPASIFSLETANAVATIAPIVASATTSLPSAASATNSSTDQPASKNGNNHGLAIGLGVGIGVGGCLLIALAILYFLKRRAKARAKADLVQNQKVSELDGSWRTQSQDPSTTKASHAASGDGVIHELASGSNEPTVAPQELDAHTYDWEPRGEPEPRDGGWRPNPN